jgi:Protein of unknown function (DUF1444)
MLESAIAYLRPDLTGEASAEVVLSGDDEPILRPLGNGMLVAYLVDEGNHYRWVQQRHLAAEGITPEALHERSILNLSRKASNALRVTDQGGFFACFLDGDFEASLLLLDDLWDRDLCELVPNGFVAGVPARDILMFCDATSESGIREVSARIERVWPNGDHLLRRELYIRSNRAWHQRLGQQAVAADRADRPRSA